ncbi:MAG: PhoH family protein [Clostridiales bacterium]|nr:PhoH family protein [Clostridiales bacterium]
MSERVIQYKTENFDAARATFGNIDENIRYLSEQYRVSIYPDGNEFGISGEEKDALDAERVLDKLIRIAGGGGTVGVGDVRMLIDLQTEGRIDDADSLYDAVAVAARGKNIRCKTVGQKMYVNAVKRNDVCFGIGPAGTGKTYLAVALAAKAYKDKEVERIVLTRPAVEAGEKLGFLPGDLQEKVDPYLRPLYDALQEMFGFETYQKLIERGTIEIAPLAYMRGRTLSNAFIILDEAQNATKEQMKMFLTRPGERSKVVVTGDVTQTDLKETSGLIHALEVLKDTEGVGIVRLTRRDVVRHTLVRNIIEAYEKYENTEKEREQTPAIKRNTL